MNSLEQIKKFIEQGLIATNQTDYSVEHDVEEDCVQIVIDDCGMPIVWVQRSNITRRSIVGDKKLPGYSIWKLVYSPPTYFSPETHDEKFVDETTQPVEAAEMAVFALLEDVLAHAFEGTR